MMKNYLKNSQLFHAIHMKAIWTIFFANMLIGYDVKNDEIILDDRKSTNIKTGLATLILLSFAFDQMLRMMYSDNPSILVKGFIVVAGCGMMVGTKNCIVAPQIRKSFYYIIFYLEFIDDLLSEHIVYSKTKRPINYIIRAFIIAFIGPLIIGFVPWIIMYIYIPSTKFVVLALILSSFILPTYIYTIIMRLLLNDRLKLFYQMILKSRNGCTTLLKCPLCWTSSNNANALCYKHATRNLERIHNLFIRLISAIDGLDNLLMPTFGFSSIILSPYFIYIAMLQIKNMDAGISRLNIVVEDIFALLCAAICCAYILIGANTIELHQNVARSLHKFYIVAHKQANVEMPIITMSMCIDLPKYRYLYLGGIFILTIESTTKIISSSIQVSALLSCFPI